MTGKKQGLDEDRTGRAIHLPTTLLLVPVLTILSGLVASLIFRGKLEPEILVLVAGGALVYFVFGVVSYRLGIRRALRQHDRQN